MNPTFLLTWLWQTLLPLGALWLLFRLALRAERGFGFNRAYLLLAPVVAAGLPLLPALGWRLPGLSGAPALPGLPPVVALPAVGAGPTAAAAGVPLWLWLTLGLYAAGVAFWLGRLGGQLGALRRDARRWPGEARPGYRLVYTGGRRPTCSFGRTVFWDETQALSPAEARAVLAHERAHVQQRHSRDLLWLEGWRALLWPNPFVHLLRPALRLTHELLADAAAAPEAPADAPDAPTYAALLARLAARPYQPKLALAHSFASFILTRLAMLQNRTPVRRWKQWLTLPVVGALLLAVSCQSKDDLGRAGAPRPGEPAPATVRIGPDPAGEAGREGEKVYPYVEQMPALTPGGNLAAIVQTIQQTLTYPKPAVKGKVFATFVVGSDGLVRDARIVKGLSPAQDAAVLAAIQKLPRFVPGRQGGRPVAVSFTVPVLFAEQGG